MIGGWRGEGVYKGLEESTRSFQEGVEGVRREIGDSLHLRAAELREFLEEGWVLGEGRSARRGTPLLPPPIPPSPRLLSDRGN